MREKTFLGGWRGGFTALELTITVLIVGGMFCVSCREGNVRAGSFKGVAGIQHVRRILVLPFPRDRKDSDTFYELASGELWKDEVFPQKDVYAEYQRLGLDPETVVLSKDQALSISSRLGADAIVAGYRDAKNVLRVKIVDLAARAALVREYDVSGSDGVRRFVKRWEHDFKNFREICRQKGIAGTSKGSSNDPAVRFVNNGAAKPPSAGGVGVSTAAATGAALPDGQPEVPDVKIGIGPFEDKDFHDFAWETFDF